MQNITAADVVRTHPDRLYIPLAKKKKKAACKWKKPDFEGHRSKAAKSDNIGWVLDNNHLVIDVDDKDGKGKGKKSLEQLFKGLPEPKPAVFTPNGGFHIYYQLTPELVEELGGGSTEKTRLVPKKNHRYSGIDFLSFNDYVVVPPSELETGRYCYADDFDPTKQEESPSRVLIDRIRDNKQQIEREAKNDNVQGGKDPSSWFYCPRAKIRACLEELNPGMEYPEWRHILACLRHWNEDEGHKLAKKWSEKSSKHSERKGWEQDFEKAWAGVVGFNPNFSVLFNKTNVIEEPHFRQAKKPLQPSIDDDEIKVLVNLYRNFEPDEYLCTLLVKFVKSLRPQKGLQIIQNILGDDENQKKWVASCAVLYNKLKTSSDDFWPYMIETNYPLKHICNLMTGGLFDLIARAPTKVLNLKYYKKFSLPKQKISFGDLKYVSKVEFDPYTHTPIIPNNLGGYPAANSFDPIKVVKASSPDALPGEEKGDFYLSLSCVITLISFVTGLHPCLYDVGRLPMQDGSANPEGLTKAHASEQAAIFLEFVYKIMKEKHFRVRWALWIHGPQGVGKTMLANILCACVSPIYTAPVDVVTLKSNFNSHVADKLLMVLHEGDFKESDKDTLLCNFKTLITDEEGVITAKGKDAVSRRIHSNFIVLTNKDNFIPDHDVDRRFVYFTMPLMTRWEIGTFLKEGAPIRDFQPFFPDNINDELRKASVSLPSVFHSEDKFFQYLADRVSKYAGELKYVFQQLKFPADYKFTDTAKPTYSSIRAKENISLFALTRQYLIEEVSVFGTVDFCICPLLFTDLAKINSAFDHIPEKKRGVILKNLDFKRQDKPGERPLFGTIRTTVYMNKNLSPARVNELWKGIDELSSKYI